MIRLKTKDGQAIISEKDIVYVFSEGDRIELRTTGNTQGFISASGSLAPMLEAGFVEATSNGRDYAINPDHCIKVLPKGNGGATVVTRKGKIEVDDYAGFE